MYCAINSILYWGDLFSDLHLFQLIPVPLVFTTVVKMLHVLILMWALIALAAQDLQAMEHFAMVNCCFSFLWR